MTTYLLMGAPFILAALLLAVRAGRHHPQFFRQLAWTAVPLIILTVVFDNILTGLPIVTYNADLISGIRIGFAPVEDFLYTIAAVLLVPSLWLLLSHDE